MPLISPEVKNKIDIYQQHCQNRKKCGTKIAIYQQRCQNMKKCATISGIAAVVLFSSAVLIGVLAAAFAGRAALLSKMASNFKLGLKPMGRLSNWTLQQILEEQRHAIMVNHTLGITASVLGAFALVASSAFVGSMALATHFKKHEQQLKNHLTTMAENG